jgi:hypothetical protein
VLRQLHGSGGGVLWSLHIWQHLLSIGVIQGHLKGHATLKQGFCSGLFLLHWRIFGPDAVESKYVPDAPSGSVPGGGGNDGIW